MSVNVDEIFENIIAEKKITVREFKHYHFGDKKKMKMMFIKAFKMVDKTFKDFYYLPEYDKVVDWLNDNKSKGLLLAGNVGRGKSVILNGVIPIIYKAVYNVELKPEIAKKITEVKTTRYSCVIDDIGTEEIIKDYGNRIDPVEYLISDCEDNARLLILSTNLNDANLKKRYGVRVVDRINRLCRLIIFQGKSFRKP